MQKFIAGGFDFNDDNTQIIISFDSEFEFLNSLHYWQVHISDYYTINIICLDRDYKLDYYDWLRMPNIILDVYKWATPEYFYELLGILTCLASVYKKQSYIQHHLDHSVVSSEDSLLNLEPLVKSLIKTYKALENWEEKHSKRSLNPSV